MKFVSLLGAVVAIKLNVEGGPSNPGDPTDYGVDREPPINQNSEYLYNATHILPFHEHVIPPSASDECNMAHDPTCSDLSHNWHHIGDQWEGPAPTPGYAQ